jgi:ketosteroid isomerase-like protein
MKLPPRTELAILRLFPKLVQKNVMIRINPSWIHEMTPAEIVLNFFDCVNRRDAGKLADWMTEDHVFIDSLGRAVQGREAMRSGWRAYFTLCPDYWISHKEILADGNVVAVFGKAGGTISADGKLPPENEWRTPAAWLAVVENGLVKEWRVYADNKPVYDILAKSSGA